MQYLPVRSAGRRAGVEHDDVLLARDIADRERNAGIRRVGDDVDLVVVDPLPRDVDADIRLVLMIAAQHLDLPALGAQAGILDRHIGRHHRIGAADIRIEAVHVVEHADLDILVVGERRSRKTERGKSYERGGAPRGRNYHEQILHC